MKDNRLSSEDNKNEEKLLELQKKQLEIQKLEKELIKIDLESKELVWRKWSAWGPTAIALITVALTVTITLRTQLFQAISERLRTESLSTKIEKDLLDAKKDALSLSIKKLRQDSTSSTNQILKKKTELTSLSIKLKKEKIKYQKLQIKRHNLINRVSLLTDSLGKEIVKAEDCFSKAKEFLTLFTKDVFDIHATNLFMSNTEKKNKPFPTRFSKTKLQIIEMNIDKMNYIQFLIETANFKIEYFNQSDSGKMGPINYLISPDSKIKIPISTNYGNISSRLVNRENTKREVQFNCWKDLSKSQKMKLLNEITQRE